MQKIYKISQYGPAQATTVVFFFCPFSIRSWQLAAPGMPIWQLTRRGYRVVSYSYSAAIANKSPELTVASIEGMLADAQQRIAGLSPTTRVVAFGASMGSVMASNLAARQSRITAVILNLSYSDIAQHIFSLPAVPLIPRGRLDNYISISGGEAGLHTIFDDYSPISLAPKLAGKRILLYLAQNDRLLQYPDTQQLPEVFRRAGASVEYYETTKSGHYMSALYNYLRPSIYLKFLKQD